MTAPTAALDLLAGLTLEDGRRWGDAATEWQWEAATTLMDPDVPPYRWESRPRGGSKTTDLAAVVLVAALAQLPPGSMVDCWAAGRDQARLLMDAMGGFVRRTPGVAALVDLSQYGARTRAGVVIEVMSADLATSYGRRPSFVVVDELCQWQAVSSAQGLWESIASSLPKVPGCRAAVITTAGSPSHWSRKVRDAAVGSDQWTVGEVGGPLPWLSQEVLDEQRRLLLDSSFQRFVLNRWAAAEDSLVGPDDLAAAVQLAGPQEPRPGVRYVVALDVGLVKDRTVAVVAHSEPVLMPGREGSRVVLDRLAVWAGSRHTPVDLGDVEAWILQASRAYGRAPVVADPWQAVSLAQRLRSAGVRVTEFNFTAQSVGRIASELMRALRDRRLALPDDAGLLDELGNVRLKESTPGVVRLDHASGGHDDRAVALALAVLHLGQGARRARFVVYPDDDAVPVASDRVAAPAAGRFRVYTEGSDEVLDRMRRRRRRADPFDGPPQRVW